MSDAVVERPSYRVAREGGSNASRLMLVAGGLLAVAAVGAAGWWGVRSMGGSSGVPVVEADPRPFKVRPDDPGGLRVPNQSELILERPQQRNQGTQASRPSTVAPGAESPDLGGLRAAAAPRVATPAPAPAPQQAAPVAQAPQPVPVVAAVAPVAPPRPVGRVQVQLGALPSEEAARAEWDRLARRAPELFQGRTPQVSRLERGEGQAPLFRLRTGGLADQEAATQFCEQVRARGGACAPLRS